MRKVLTLLFLVTAFANAQVPINRGMSGSWFNPATPGQGMFLDVGGYLDTRPQIAPVGLGLQSFGF